MGICHPTHPTRLKVLVCPLQLATHSSNKNPEIEMGIQASYGSSIPSYEGAGRE